MATMTDTQMLPFTLQPMKADGTPASVQAGSVVYASSDETVMTVTGLSADQLSGNVSAVAEGGPARITVQADADLGAGVVTITGVSEDVTVTADPANLASTFTFTFGPAVPKA
jgi:hypothetical protein